MTHSRGSWFGLIAQYETLVYLFNRAVRELLGPVGAHIWCSLLAGDGGPGKVSRLTPQAVVEGKASTRRG